MAGPRDQDRHAAPAPPPRPTRGIARGPKAPPQPTPPPHRPEGGRGGGPPTPPAPTTAGEPQARPSAPPGPGGHPPLRRNGGAIRATAAGPAPANPHRRAEATRTTEQEGGRAPHDPPVTTAHSEVTEGGFQVRWGPQGGGPRAAPHPPHPGAALQHRPHARAGRVARRRHGESQKGVPQAAARNESREAAARHPPPPRPPTGPPAAGAPAPTPRGRGDGPPPPERRAGV